MKKTNLFILLFITTVLYSCKDDNKSHKEYSFIFFPRQVQTTWSDNVCLQPEVKDQDGNMTYSINETFTGKSCKAEYYMLGLYTCNLAYDTTDVKKYLTYETEYSGNWPVEYTHFKPIYFFHFYEIRDLFTDEHCVSIEQQLKDDYTKYANEQSTSSSEWSSPPINQEYRLTEIVDLTITCNKSLFGQSAGNSLNDYFHIYTIEPGCIFSGNNQLEVTHETVQKKIKAGLTIHEWLSYRPLSAAYYYFKLAELPSGLPVEDVEFSITLETINGDQIACVGKKITLTP